MTWETVIGLEVHVQLKTATKIFCSCPNRFGQSPNTQTCPVCLGLPGSLPVLNRQALRLATRAALALEGTIAPVMKFDRKNYFYPDLPKGYQISQSDLPLSSGGGITLEDGTRITLTRIHLEEDAGKLLHSAESIDESEKTRVDLNRAGTPLIEIVTEPDFRTPEQAYEFLTTLKQLMEYGDVSDCNMEEGSLRCDGNVSIRKAGDTKLGTKVEIKNLNSFKAVQAALHFEIARQTRALEHGEASGEKIIQETRLWDADRNVTRSMRGKEMAHDYRYFPDPDLVSFTLTEEFIESVRKEVPETPQQKAERFIREWQIPEKTATILSYTRQLADYFEESVEHHAKNPVGIANWMTGEFLRVLSDKDPSASKVKPKALSRLIALIDAGIITGKIAKDVFMEMVESGADPEKIVEEKGLRQMSDEGELAAVVDEVISENPGPVEEYRGGKMATIGFLVGQVMKKTQGKANPQLVNKLLKEKLG